MPGKIEESQQQSQGVTIGTQGNEDMNVPDGQKGSQQSKESHDDRHIPNQDKSSASNMDKSDNKGSE